MEDEKYSYWQIDYISCEGNSRWTIARAPKDWDDYDVQDRIPMGGCGDDVSQIKGVSESFDTDYSWDFCD